MRESSYQAKGVWEGTMGVTAAPGSTGSELNACVRLRRAGHGRATPGLASDDDSPAACKVDRQKQATG